jgi:multiphosphoryl transfer protein
VPLLLGLGVKSLSVAPSSVAAMKQAVRLVDTVHAARVAEQALRCATAAEVRQIAQA